VLEPEINPAPAFADLLSAIKQRLTGKKAEAAPAAAGAPAADTKDAAPGAEPPKIDPAGINTELAIGEFVSMAKSICADETWKKLGTKDRLHELCGAANLQLAMAKVLPARPAAVALGDETRQGQFSLGNWQLSINTLLLEKETLSKKEAGDLADTTYHEARHAEQAHKMARMLAGRKQNVAQIVAQTGIDAEAAADAFGKPMAPDAPEAAEAQKFFDSYYSKEGAAHRNKTLTAVESTTLALQAAQEAYNGAPPDNRMNEHRALEAAKNAYKRAMRDYKALPEEEDAFAVGAKVFDLYMKD
jgi:hypothetical protein